MNKSMVGRRTDGDAVLVTVLVCVCAWVCGVLFCLMCPPSVHPCKRPRVRPLPTQRPAPTRALRQAEPEKQRREQDGRQLLQEQQSLELRALGVGWGGGSGGWWGWWGNGEGGGGARGLEQQRHAQPGGQDGAQAVIMMLPLPAHDLLCRSPPRIAAAGGSGPPGRRPQSPQPARPHLGKHASNSRLLAPTKGNVPQTPPD